MAREAFTEGTSALAPEDAFTRQVCIRDPEADREMYVHMCVGEGKEKVLNHERTDKLRNSKQLSVASPEHYQDRLGGGAAWKKFGARV